jgi:hypothetical protein
MNANNRNIFIFDWDDTLFPTSWLLYKKYINNNSMVSLSQLNLEDQSTLTNYSQKIAILLEKCLHIGHVIIVTNADNGWISTCISKFMPNLVELITRILCYSAKHLFQKTFIPFYWKVATFSHALHNYMDKKYQTSVISFGDSEYEKNANKLFCMNYENCYSKVIKYIENPSITQLEKENDLVSNYIHHICSYAGNIDNTINKKFIMS